MNLNLIYLMYGLAYFTMGLAVWVKIRPLLDNQLARVFGWLVAFGLIHAIHEWMEMFVIMGHAGSNILVVSTLIVALSFAALLQFGVEFMGLKKKIPRIIRFCPVILLFLWFLFYLRVLSYDEGIRLAEIWSRYTLGFFSTFLTAYALTSQRKNIADSPIISKNFLLAGISFGVYGIFTVVVPEADFFPASVLNYPRFANLVGIPIQIFKMLSAVAITYFIVKSLDVFDVLEKRRLIDQVWEMTGDLEESEEKYRTLFELANDAFLTVVPPRGEIVDTNEAAAQMLGYLREEMRGLSSSDIIAPEVLGETKREWTKQVEERGYFLLETIWRRKDGSQFPVEISGQPLEIRGQALFQLIGRDITERRQAEEALRESEESFRMLTLTANDAIIGIDNEACISIWNNAATRIFGFSKSEAIGMNLHSLIVPKEFRKKANRGLEKFSKSGKGPSIGTTIELTGLRKDGTEFPVELSVSRLKKGGAWHATGIVRDITERKQSEERIIRQRALLDGINNVFRETFTCETAEEVANTCLSVAEELTGSQFGWIGIVNQSGRFDVIAVSGSGWEINKMLRPDAENMIQNMEIRGIWGRVLKDRQPMIVNDLANHPDSVGTPEGHIPLTSFLGIPLKRAGEIIGMFALANKVSGYDLSDQEDMEALSIAFVVALNRKWAEEALKDSESKYRSLFENANDAIIIFEPDNEIILEANTKAFDIYGFSRDEFVGMSLKEISKDVTTGKKRIRQTVQEGTIDNFETVHIKKDGTTINILVSASVINYEGKQAILSINRDITEHMRVEEALRKSDEKFRNLFDHASDAIFIHDIKGHFLEVNKMAYQRLGYTKKQLLQMTPMDIDTPEYAALIPSKIKELRQKGFVIFESAHVRQDGKTIPVEISSRTIEYRGEPAILSIARDITDRKQAQEILQRSEEEYKILSQQLMEANNMKELLLDVITHDLKNPAGVISEIANMMIDKFPGNDMVEVIKDSSKSLLQVVERTTLLSQVALGEEIRMEEIDLAEVIKEVVNQFLPSLKDKGMNLENHMPETLLIQANPIVEEVFTNYISNAIKYASEGQRIIIEAFEDNKSITVGIKDFGQSISEKNYQSIFVRSTQLAMGAKHGRGLGLAIVKRIAQAHNGKAWVEANKPVGNIFYLKIPKI